MSSSSLTFPQRRGALIKCSAQLAAIVARSVAADAKALTIGQCNRAEFHDIVVHALGLLRGPTLQAGSYRTMITRAYAASVHPQEGAPRIDALRAIIAVLNTVVAGIATEHDGMSDQPDRD